MAAPTPRDSTAPAEGKGAKTKERPAKCGTKEMGSKMDTDQLQLLEELPNSAAQLHFKEILKKLTRQERVVDEVEIHLKPHYTHKRITKEEYKHILRKSVPKICHSKSGEINPIKIASLVEAYVRKVRYEKKKTTVNEKNTPPATDKEGENCNAKPPHPL